MCVILVSRTSRTRGIQQIIKKSLYNTSCCTRLSSDMSHHPLLCDTASVPATSTVAALASAIHLLGHQMFCNHHLRYEQQRISENVPRYLLPLFSTGNLNVRCNRSGRADVDQSIGGGERRRVWECRRRRGAKSAVGRGIVGFGRWLSCFLHQQLSFRTRVQIIAARLARQFSL